MDVDRVGRGTLIAAVSGILLFIFMFFAWYGASVPDEVQEAIDLAEGIGANVPDVGDTTINAWEAFDFTDLIMLLAVIVSVGFGVIALTGASVSLPIAGSAVTTGIGAIAFLFVLYRLINPPGSGDIDREIGAFLGLLASAGIAVGGWMAMQEEGTSFQDVKRDLGGSES